ncbi:DUF2922 domain-containing protein [Alkalihalobacillus sp. LMS39]|uniref:DUF2922 domain-containing protein n=1 Tax=Alkalihalobacillus sp. LMS39 TaxID=2924032 RepID=UPI001FB36B3D|nr:DUF2922 domain-containing protein [Alkalihalobacillus sp. LMS39]UOE96236.1 DUF2922 domain-containing protein [Alkalihalobacillus sp. LMS39]
MNKRLELLFQNESGATVTLSLDNPIYPAEPIAIRTAMEGIIMTNCFTSTGGNIVAIKSARIVDRTVEEVLL